MKRYTNKSGNSGITAFEVGKNYIIIQFKDGGKYLYNEVQPGKNHVQQLKFLAEEGKGLATYINQHVRENYFEKI